jgi:hypothetical protein
MHVEDWKRAEVVEALHLLHRSRLELRAVAPLRVLVGEDPVYRMVPYFWQVLAGIAASAAVAYLWLLTFPNENYTPRIEIYGTISLLAGGAAIWLRGTTQKLFKHRRELRAQLDFAERLDHEIFDTTNALESLLNGGDNERIVG